MCPLSMKTTLEGKLVVGGIVPPFDKLILVQTSEEYPSTGPLSYLLDKYIGKNVRIVITELDKNTEKPPSYCVLDHSFSKVYSDKWGRYKVTVCDQCGYIQIVPAIPLEIDSDNCKICKHPLKDRTGCSSCDITSKCMHCFCHVHNKDGRF